MELRYRHRKHFVVLDICGIVCDQNVVQNEVLKQIGLGRNPPQPKLKLAWIKERDIQKLSPK